MRRISYSPEKLAELYGELHKATRTGNTHLYRVILALILIGEKKHALKEVAELVNVTVKTLFNWLKKFMCHGMKLFSMHWFKGRGRKSKLSKDQHEELRKMIEQGPLEHGFNCGGWNTAMINELIKMKFGVDYNLHYLPRLLKKIGLTYQKAKFISDRMDEEEYHAKREEWITVKLPEILEKAKEKGAIVLFGDEVSFAMWGSLGRTWAPVGKQPVVKTRGNRKGLKMYGAIEVAGGDFHYRESFHYSLTRKSFTALKKAGMSVDAIKLLKTSMNKKVYRTHQTFLEDVQACLDKDMFRRHESDVLQHAEISGRFNGEGYIEFLKQLADHYDKPVILIEDGASYHGSKVVREFLAEQTVDLTLERLPAFSPDYNPIEKLWKNTKRDATHLKYFKQFEDLRDSVISTFKTYLEDASKVLCVMTKMRKEFGLTC